MQVLELFSERSVLKHAKLLEVTKIFSGNIYLPDCVIFLGDATLASKGSKLKGME